MTECTYPTFVVVGNVNQGKSSIVAALAEDPTVPIASHPGTTVRSGEYQFKSGGEVIFRLVDTPGFQEARTALHWMQERSSSAADHPEMVRAFIETFEGSDRYQDEVRLLKPIMEGAAILYVVDASSRFQPSHEAEMEILRWTGRSAMALINRTRDRDHEEEWRPILEQFFNVVRTFNAHESRFQDRMGLLRSFREIRQDWREEMDRALEIIQQDWDHRQHRAARILGEFMASSLSLVERERIQEDSDKGVIQQNLEKRFRENLRTKEAEARRAIEQLYHHSGVSLESDEFPLLASDLFSDVSARAFGLTPTQLAQSGALWGAAIGGAVDLMVGGLSFFTGAMIGAVAGGAAGYFGGSSIARTWNTKPRWQRILTPGDSGEFQCMGPVTNPRFAWVLMDRALVHFVAVRDRSHATQEKLDLTTDGDKKQGLAHDLPKGLRSSLDERFREIIQDAIKENISLQVAERLSQDIDAVLRHLAGSA